MTTPERTSPPTAGDQLRGIKDQLIGQTKQTIRQARDQAGSSLAESKGQLAEQVGSLANAFRRSAERLREDDRTTVAGITETVAEQAERVADYLNRVDGPAVRRDLEDFARRQPAAVLGGAFALGLLAARFLKSSGREGRRDSGTHYGGDREARPMTRSVPSSVSRPYASLPEVNTGGGYAGA
jgi:hypothetical protein